MKTVVTHISPDLDAITAVWLVIRYFPDCEGASIVFVPAGKTLNNMAPDEDPRIIHVDTGFGKFDHHQSNEFTSASKKVFQHIIKNAEINEKAADSLARIVDFVTDIDHFRDVYYPDPQEDRYDFLLHQIIETVKYKMRNDEELTRFVFPILDSYIPYFKRKGDAENDIERGYIFESFLGKALALETQNGEAARLAQKKGYVLVVTKDPARGNIRIRTLPGKDLDLTPVYDKLTSIDKEGTWFLHASKAMLLNGSSKNPEFKPTKLSLKRVIEILQNF